MSRSAQLLFGAAVAGASGQGCAGEQSPASSHPKMAYTAEAPPKVEPPIATDAGEIPDGPQPKVIPIYGNTGVLGFLWQVHFPLQSSKISKEAAPLFGEMAATFVMHEPDFARMGLIINVTGHADPSEKDAAKLSLERARQVRAALIHLGVDPSVLVAVGRGAEEPIERPPGGMKSNPRVEFKLVDRVDADGG